MNKKTKKILAIIGIVFLGIILLNALIQAFSVMIVLTSGLINVDWYYLFGQIIGVILGGVLGTWGINKCWHILVK